MRIIRFGHGMALLAGAAASANLVSCGSSCDDTLDCGPYVSFQPSGGSGGASADGGSSGSGGSSSGSGGSGGSIGEGGMAGMGGGGGGCDLTQSPLEAPCVVSDEHAVFVSPNGSDEEGNGTMAMPYGTLAKAIEEATKDGGTKRVHACSGGAQFEEALSLGSGHSGLRMYGGFSCDDWSYDESSRTTVLAATSIAIRATQVNGLYIENFNVVAADATGPGTSSFGVFIASSQSVVLRRMDVTAGKGAAGAVGTDGTKGADGAVVGEEQAGKAAVCGGSTDPTPGGNWVAASACGSRGGKGGDGLHGPLPALSGAPGSPGANLVDPSPGLGLGGGGASQAGKAGDDGENGSAGQAGTDGLLAPEIGTFTSTGYAPANGNDGTDGFPGQGGGGGGASMGSTECVGASGGAGGMGGCGGTKGGGGGGGGASVALFSWNSTVLTDACVFTSAAGGVGGKGGNGGAGGFGSQGASGGKGDLVYSIAGGGRGGRGGDGGNAGSGSGGTGGPSFAVAYKGAQPDTTTSTLVPGQGGGKGAGGALGSAMAPDGLVGMSAEIYPIP